MSRVDATQVATHIHRLCAAGWTRRSIALVTGVGITTVYRLSYGQPKVQPETAAAILSLAPDTSIVTDDVDEAVVLRIMAGTNTPANRAERREVVARWRDQGRSLNELEQITGWNAHRYTDDQQVAS